jgi:hypothetical protein
MGGARHRNAFGDVIAEPRCINICEKVLSRAEQGWGNGQVHLVDKSRAGILELWQPCRRAGRLDYSPRRLRVRVPSLTKWKVGPASIVIEARG